MKTACDFKHKRFLFFFFSVYKKKRKILYFGNQLQNLHFGSFAQFDEDFRYQEVLADLKHPIEHFCQIK